MPYYLRAVDLSPDRSWELVRWGHAHGATEFSWREITFVGHADPVVQDANAILNPFRLPDEPRPRSVVYKGEPDRQLSKLWRLDEQAISVLTQLLVRGLFTPPSASQDSWIEDPTFYRGGDILLGVVSHEGEAFLQVSPPEADELMGLGFALYPRGVHI